MMTRLLTLFAVVLLLAPVPAAADPAPPDESGRHAAVDARFAQYARPGSPGLAVGIYRGGRELYAHGYGLADLDNPLPITPETVFHVASVSKQFTAFAVLLLAREGKVDLDADIRRYLPYVPDFGHVITVRQLLNHTSGLRDQWNLFDLGGIESGNRRRQTQIVNMVTHQQALNFTPGTEFLYCNTGYTLLAELVRAVSGKTLREFTTERIFSPLGMKRMFVYDDPTEVVPGRAQSYEQDASGQWRRQPLFLQAFGATSLHATVGDFGRWAQNFAHPTVGDPKLIEEFTSMGKLADGTPINYGFGLYRRTILGHAAVLHSGSDAGFRAVFAYFPAEDLSVAILANMPLDTERALQDVAGIFLGGHESNPTPTVVPDATAVAALVGQYQARTGPILTIESRAKGLEINEPGSSQWTPLVTRADGTLDVGDWPRSQGKFYRIVRDGAGHVIELLDTPWSGRTGNDGRTHHFKRLPPFVVAAVNRAELVGDYRSSELDATYTLSDVSGTLRADSIFLPQPVELKPVVKDGFQAAGPMAYVAVERDPRGRPVALLITTNRVRNLRFDRVAGSGLH